MLRLYRPSIPVAVKCRVAMRQLGELWPDEALKANEGGLQAFLDRLLHKLREILNEKKLHLDHDPALGAREIVPCRRGDDMHTAWLNNFNVPIRYQPDANDPEYLVYRGKHAHHIKTNVRGDGAQHPDRVLIKKERRRREGKRAKPKRKWRTRPFPKSKRKIPSRPFR